MRRGYYVVEIMLWPLQVKCNSEERAMNNKTLKIMFQFSCFASTYLERGDTMILHEVRRFVVVHQTHSLLQYLMHNPGKNFFTFFGKNRAV